MPRILIILLALCLATPAMAEDGDSLGHDPMETWGWRAAMLSSLALTMMSNPLNADEVSGSLMSGPDVAGFKMAFRWHPEETIAQFGEVRLKHYYLLGYNYWQSLDENGQEGVVNALEMIPVFRFSWGQKDWLSFAETSVGISVFSRTELNDRQFSTNFQFANSLAVGGFLSEKTSWSLQLQHYSNNSIKLPNNGINFYNLNIAYRY
ncbi:MAG: acyloxyacyl hydrolase [Bermanella sp.]